MVKRALLIGINYENKGGNELRGCITDSKNIAEYLVRKRGFDDKDISVLIDYSEKKPTRNNILREFVKLICSDADELFFIIVVTEVF